MALTNSEYQTIMRDYEELQQQHRAALNARRALVYEKLPVLSEIDDQLIRGSVQAAKLALSGDSSALDALSRTNERLIQQKKDLLARAGFPDNYLEMTYHCPLCKDTGSVNHRPCNCFKQAVIDKFYLDPGRKELLEHENFSTFRFDFYSESLVDHASGLTHLELAKRAYNRAVSFVERFDKNRTNLRISGSTGVGKTFLTNCIAKALLDKGYTVLYLSAFRMFELFERYRFGDKENKDEAAKDFDMVLDCDLLIIDDLGTEMPNSYTVSQLFSCIDERALRRASTIISTNLTMDEIRKRYSERIASRLMNYESILLLGGDIRVKKVMRG